MDVKMKKLKLAMILFFTCIILLSTISVSGEKIEISKLNNSPVIVEFFTNIENSDSSVVSERLYRYYSDIYPYSQQAESDFYYITMIDELSEKVQIRAQELGVSSYPTVSFDGGFINIDEVPQNRNVYENAVSESSSRDKHDIEIYLDCIWSSSPCYPEIVINIDVLNLGNFEYEGFLLIYFARIVADCENPAGRPYDFVFEDFAADVDLSIDTSPLGYYKDQLLYHPVVPGCYSFNAPNYLVVASVYSKDTGFADCTVAARLSSGEQPFKPTRPHGKTKIQAGSEYEYTTSSSDYDGDMIKYVWDWNGDYKPDEWTDYYPSGEKIDINHLWEDKGTFKIMVKATDENGFESFWSDPLTVSTYKNTKIQQYIDNWINDQIIKNFNIWKRLLFNWFYK
jgi:hypothetical protein